MTKTNLKLVPDFGSTETGLLVTVRQPAPTATRTALPSTSSVLVRGHYQRQPDGRGEVVVSIDPAAIERKVALRGARGAADSASSITGDSLFSSLR